MSDLKEIKSTVKRIESGLFGDEELGVEGIASQVKKNTKHRQNQWKVVGAIGAFFTTLGVLIKELWHKLS